MVSASWAVCARSGLRAGKLGGVYLSAKPHRQLSILSDSFFKHFEWLGRPSGTPWDAGSRSSVQPAQPWQFPPKLNGSKKRTRNASLFTAKITPRRDEHSKLSPLAPLNHQKKPVYHSQAKPSILPVWLCFCTAAKHGAPHFPINSLHASWHGRGQAAHHGLRRYA